MKEKIYFFTGISIFFLFFLIFLNFLIGKKLQKSSSSPSPSPTSISFQNNFFGQKKISRPQKNPTPTFSQLFLSQIKIFSAQESLIITNFIKKLPIENEDFSAQYLSLSNKIVFTAKNNQAIEKISQFLEKEGLNEIIKKNPEIITITTQDKINEYLQQEENLLKSKDEKFQLSSSTQTIAENISTPASSLNLNSDSPQESLNQSLTFLIDFLKIFTELVTTTTPYPTTLLSQTTPNPTFISPSPTQNLPNLTYTSLDDLFNEVGTKVGVPPKILKGVMTIEMPSTFRLSNEEVKIYSQPGNVIPNCIPNVCSATGPMQITIGIDNLGSPNCSSCCNKTRCLTSCPNQWAIYGTAVNIFSNENHQPNPCNLRDNVYAAAYKLKTDSGATDPINWTQDQVFRAGTRYYGSCSDAYRYERLGGRTYCEFLWWFYNEN